MKKQPRTLTEGHIRRYALYLQEQERSAATIMPHRRTRWLWIPGSRCARPGMTTERDGCGGRRAP